MSLFKFTNLIDIIQFFANEWCKPKNNILIFYDKKYDYQNIKNLFDYQNIKNLFDFINCETFFVGKNLDFNNSEYLPFEENSFDIIINLSNLNSFNCYLKQNGVLLTNQRILNAQEYYQCNDIFFSVI